MKKLLLVPKALAVTLFACGSHGLTDGGTDGGHDAGTKDSGTDDSGTMDAGNDDGGADAGCDCKGMCPVEDCFPFSDGDGGTLCECAI